jgi:hypothetical protein
MGMLQVGCETDLSQEALGAEDGCQLGSEELERNGAIMLQVAGEKDRSHPASPELALDDIAIKERIS